LTEQLINSLVAWTDVIKSTHPGSLSHLRFAERLRIEQAIHDYLSLRLSWRDIGLCVAPNPSGKYQIAIPEDWADSFSDWFAERIDAGLLDRQPKVRNRRATMSYFPDVCAISDFD
jgi:hypothetical protein